MHWKVEVPGHGSSSPGVWRDFVIVTTAVPIAKALPRPPAVRGFDASTAMVDGELFLCGRRHLYAIAQAPADARAAVTPPPAPW